MRPNRLPAQLPGAGGSKTRDKRLSNDAPVQVNCAGWLGAISPEVLSLGNGGVLARARRGSDW